MGTEDKKEKTLEYFISEKSPFAVVTFVGEMAKATLDVLESCHKDLEKNTATLYVIVLRDVSGVDLNAVSPLVRLQKLLRDKGALVVCSIRPEIKQFLLEKAAIREGEIESNLTDALTRLKVEQAKAKVVKG